MLQRPIIRRSSFWSVYLSVVLATALPLGLFGVFYKRSYDAELAGMWAQMLRPAMALVAQEHQRADISSNIPLQVRYHDLVGLDAELVPALPEDATAADHAALAAGNPVVYIRVTWVDIYLSPPPEPSQTAASPGLVHLTAPKLMVLGSWRGPLMVALLVIVGLVVARLFLRPLQRQLDDLSGAAARFGAGDLAARSTALRQDAAGRLATSFNAMAERIGELIGSQRQLLAAVSHELRTPLSRLRFGLALVDEDGSAESRTQRIEELESDIAELDGLVDELLTVARLDDAAPIVRKPVDVAVLLTEVVQQIIVLYPDVTFETDCPELDWPELDERLVRRAVRNLVSNAGRHAGSRVKVSAKVGRCKEVMGDALQILVDDDGPGIPVAQRRRALEPFVRFTDAPGGAGLGLAISARVASAHMGALVIEDSPLGGARLRLVLPYLSP